jgi:hypothetical protein
MLALNALKDEHYITSRQIRRIVFGAEQVLLASQQHVKSPALDW